MRTLCSVSGCSRNATRKGICNTHHVRMEKFGTFDAPSRGKSANYNWQEIPGYDALHRRLRLYRGRASEFACEGCGEKPAAQWAYDHKDPDARTDPNFKYPDAVYSTKLEHYLALCRSCHAALDFSVTESRNKAVLTVEQVRYVKCRLAADTYRGILKELAEELGVDHTTISAIKHGRNWAWVQ